MLNCRDLLQEAQPTLSGWHRNGLFPGPSDDFDEDNMIQQGRLYCDSCQLPLILGGESSIQVLVELVRGGCDRHFCAKCFEAAKKPAARSARKWEGAKSLKTNQDPTLDAC